MFIFRLFFNYVLLVGLLLGTGATLMAYGAGYSFMDMYAFMNNLVVILIDIGNDGEMVGCLYEMVNGEYVQICGDAAKSLLN